MLAAGLDETVVVLGGDAEAVSAALRGLPVRTVVNPRYAEGQSTSLRAGLDALRPGTEAALVALGDQPLPDPGVIRRLVAAFRDDGPADRRAASTGTAGGTPCSSRPRSSTSCAPSPGIRAGAE